MSFDVEQALYYRIANAQVLRYPFPHFYIPEVFPREWYESLIDILPEQRYYMRIDETGTVPEGAFPERFVCDLARARQAELDSEGKPGPWDELAKVLEGDEFAQCVLTLFYDAVVERFGKDCELDFEKDCRVVRDFSNYAIPPHTDSRKKLISLLFYMPLDDSMRELGTSIFVPKDPTFRCEGTVHHPFSKFKKVYTAPYLPNSLLGFFKTTNAFHGVERIKQPHTQRDSVLYNIYVKNVAQRTVQPTT